MQRHADRTLPLILIACQQQTIVSISDQLRLRDSSRNRKLANTQLKGGVKGGAMMARHTTTVLLGDVLGQVTQ